MSEMPIQLENLPGWALRAAHDLRRGDHEDEWIAEGDDPQFLLDPPTALESGWYRVRVELRAISGVINNPILYIDHGSGFRAESQVLLAPGGVDGPISTTVWLHGPLVRFRLDPSDRNCVFEMTGLRVHRLSPSEAVWVTLTEEREWWGLVSPRRFAAFLAQARTRRSLKGDRAVVDWVHDLRSSVSDPCRYLRWIHNAEARFPDTCTGGPSLSVVMLPRSDIADAKACYEGVVEQLGAQDELLIPALLAQHLPQPLATQVHVLESKEGAEFFGLSSASNAYVTWLGAGERLHSQGLAVIRRALQKRPEVRLAYTDEDFIDADGQRSSPYFKPEWDREMLLVQDYPARSVVMEREVATDFAERVTGEAWLYAACLEAREALGAHEIERIPAVTRHHVHKRGALHAPLHADAVEIQAPMREALARWRDRTYADVSIERTESGLPHLVWPIPSGVRVDIVIPTRDRVDLLSTCVDSILKLTRSVHYSLIVLDNGSSDADSLEYLSRIALDPRVRVIQHNVPFNYSAINNYAVAQGAGDVVVLLNNDVEVIEGHWLAELVGLAMRPEVGAVGAKLLYPDGLVQHAGVLLGVGAVTGGVAAHAHAHAPASSPGYFGRAVMPQRMSAVTAACLAVRREVFEAVGGLDPELAIAFNDVDFCLRVQEAGYSNVWTPHAVLLHHESASRGYEDTPEKRARFLGEIALMHTRWSALMGNDPAYNPNLALAPKEYTIDPNRFAVL